MRPGAGVCAVSSLPPQGGYSFEEFRAFYAELASASPAQVVIYYYPEVAPGLSSSQVVDLCALPNVAGVKFTSFELHRIPEMIGAGGYGAQRTRRSVRRGTPDGSVGRNRKLLQHRAEDVLRGVLRAKQCGEWDEARRVQDCIGGLISIVLRFPMIPGVEEDAGVVGPALRRRPRAAAEAIGGRGACAACGSGGRDSIPGFPACLRHQAPPSNRKSASLQLSFNPRER